MFIIIKSIMTILLNGSFGCLFALLISTNNKRNIRIVTSFSCDHYRSNPPQPILLFINNKSSLSIFFVLRLQFLFSIILPRSKKYGHFGVSRKFVALVSCSEGICNDTTRVIAKLQVWSLSPFFKFLKLLIKKLKTLEASMIRICINVTSTICYFMMARATEVGGKYKIP